MISECLKDINKPTNIMSFYQQEPVIKHPPLLICKDKLDKQNKDIIDYRINFEAASLGGNPNDEHYIHLKNTNSAGILLFEGYSRNIDIDSELKGINYYDDKCFYDNYKINPSKVTPKESPLALYKNDLVPDYHQHKDEYINYNIPNQCIAKQQIQNFELCNRQNFYNFPQGNKCPNYPCQKPFNNITHRRMIEPDHYDINPKKC